MIDNKVVDITEFTDFYMTELSHKIHEFFVTQGFSSPESISETESVGAKLMMIVTELAEAMEAVRDHNEENFAEEIADVVIRILHLCGSMDIDISQEIYRKMVKNTKREYRHGHVDGV